MELIEYRTFKRAYHAMTIHRLELWAWEAETVALRINSVQKKCEIDALSPEEVLKREDAKDKEESVEYGGDETEETRESQDAVETQ